VTIDQFLTVLTQCNLLSEQKLGDVREQILHNSRMDPHELAKSLVAEGQLTNWQARQLLLGQNAFFLGKYELLDCIGRGGMGVVFKARHAVMDRIVALKIMSPALLRRGNAVARFNREVKTVAALHHPNIIGAYDADCVGNTHFLVMEYAEGRDLNYWLRTLGRMPISLVCECILQAAEGLAHAFRLGMVHRDIKPVNMLVTWQHEIDRPVIKILDLGLARFASETQEEGGLTRVGQTIGTPDYIAPEAALNFKNADIRADIFSLGCAMFKLLTARLPFEGDNTMAKLMARTSRDAPRVSSLRKDVPPEVDAIVAKMLARDPKDRFQTPAEVIAAIAPFAASTRNEQSVLQVFKSAPPAGDSTSLDAPDGDPEGELIEFFRDIGFAPAEQSDGSPSGDRGDDELRLAPLEDEPTRDDTVFQPKPAKPAPPPSREPFKPRASPAGPAETKRGRDARSGRESQRVPEPAAKAPKKSRLKPEEDEVLSMEDVLVEEIPVLGADDLVSEPVGAPFGTAPSAARGRRVGRPGKKGTVWDSPLLLIGGGALLLLLILGGGLIWSLTRQTGDELLRLAEDDYRGGSFTSAIHRYNQYLQDFPTHPQASLAKVHRGLAQLRQEVDAGGNWPEALAVAQRVIDEIRTEPEFGEARGELAALLPKIAKGLADKALAQQDLKAVEQAVVALGLIDKYVLKSQRPEPAIKDVEAILEQTRRQVARDDRLQQAIAAMQANVAMGATNTAYDTRRRLLKDYPDLEDNPELAKTLLAVSAAERQAVKQVNEPRQPETDEPPSPVLGSLALAVRGAGTAPGVEGRVVYALAEGAAYGLDATSGQLLWRRFVGYDTQFVPLPLQPGPEGDCLLVDAVRHEVLRADSRTGQIRWRHPLNEPFDSEPVILRKRLVLATESGRLVSIDLASGSSSGYTQVPQPLRVGPAVDSRERYFYQLGDRANLYVVSAETGECPEVIYLGHESSSIRVPPLAVSRYVIVAENHLSSNSRLRVLVTNEQGLSVTPVQDIELEGHIFERPQIAGSTLVATTDRGAVYMFQIGAPGDGSPLTLTAEQ
jgi:serine/threonine protein kinase/tetratricopeptide (TPR) repeat protein